jgi:hypothetical protein
VPVPWIRSLVAILSPQKPGFDLWGTKWHWDRQAFLLVRRFSHVSVIRSTLHAQLRLHVAVTRRTKGKSQRAFEEKGSVGNWGELYRNVLSLHVVHTHTLVRGGAPSPTDRSIQYTDKDTVMIRRASTWRWSAWPVSIVTAFKGLRCSENVGIACRNR